MTKSIAIQDILSRIPNPAEVEKEIDGQQAVDVAKLVDTIVSYIRESYNNGPLSTTIPGNYKRRVTDTVTSLFGKKEWSVSFQQIDNQTDGNYLQVRIQQLPRVSNPSFKD